MDNLKKLLFVGFILCLNFNVLAQTSPFRFGVKAGLNLSGATVNDATNTDLKTGYHIGGTVEYLLSNKFLIQSGLFFSTKGSKIDNLNGSGYDGGKPNFTHTFNEMYMELPLHGAYRMNVSSNFNIVFGAGPYLGCGIGGKTKQKLNSGIWSGGVTKIEWDTFGSGIFDKNRDHLRGETLKRFDFGMGASIDLEYHKFILGIGYSHSIMNVANNDDYESLKYRNNNIQFSVGYKF